MLLDLWISYNICLLNFPELLSFFYSHIWLRCLSFCVFVDACIWMSTLFPTTMTLIVVATTSAAEVNKLMLNNNNSNHVADWIMAYVWRFKGLIPKCFMDFVASYQACSNPRSIECFVINGNTMGLPSVFSSSHVVKAIEQLGYFRSLGV